MEIEPDYCRARLQALQGECRRMEEMVASMLQFKAKVDQLRHENSSMKASFETNLQKYCGHISALERDNAMLRNQVKKMESQLHGMGNDRDKIALLLERLKIVEVENSCLVLENEKQRQQYEKCLDEIANQVVQALLAQKTLREECLKLQHRVLDLEQQNRELNIMFQQRLKSASDPIDQKYVCDSIGQSQSCTTLSYQGGSMIARHGLRHASSQSLSRSVSSTSSSTIQDTSKRLVQLKAEMDSPACLSMNDVSLYKRRARSLEYKFSNPVTCGRRSLSCEIQINQDSDVQKENYFPVSRLKQSLSDSNISHFETTNHIFPSTIQLNKPESQNKSVPQKIFGFLKGSNKSVCGNDRDDHRVIKTCGKNAEISSSRDVSGKSKVCALETVLQVTEPFLTEATKSSFVQNKHPSYSSVDEMSRPQSLPSGRRSTFVHVLGKPLIHSLKSLKSPSSAAGQCYYYDYSDEESDSRSLSQNFNPMSSRSLNSTESKLKTRGSSSSKIRPTFSESFTSPAALMKPTQRKATNISVPSQRTTAQFDVSKSGRKQIQNSSLALKTQKKTAENSDGASNTVFKDAKTRILKSSTSEKQNTYDIISGNLAKDEKFLRPKSSIFTQKSQSLGHSSKGRNSHLSPPFCSSMLKGGAVPWLQSTKIPASSSHEFVISAKINDCKGQSSRSRDDRVSKVTRPGQLILAPEDKTFNFPGFSSSSSTSSEDKTPLKLFESKQKVDMKSSVIEVKKDGTFVQAMRSIGDTSSDTSNSISDSPCSPKDSASKIPQTVTKKQTTTDMSKAEPSVEDCKDDEPKKFSQPKVTNITVGLLHNQVIPRQPHFEDVEGIIKKVMRETKLKNELSQSKDIRSHVQTKSSDPSFDNVRVERSGSKDDGYSTMSSDIHPEVLEKFCESVTRRLSVPSSEPYSGVRNMPAESSTLSDEATRCSSRAQQSHDKSFDLTSDPDSALETSAHSTAEMVTSTSSQLSTSSSDFPLSPCSTKPSSKVIRILDRESPQLYFAHGNGKSGQHKTKETIVSSSSKISISSSSPASPNTIVPNSYQQPESPRRLANEFQKIAPVKHTPSSSAVQNLASKSPKASYNSCGPAQVSSTQQQIKLGTAHSSDKKLTRTKQPGKTKAQVVNSASSVTGFQSLTQQNTKNACKSVNLTKAQATQISNDSKDARCKHESGEVKSNPTVVLQDRSEMNYSENLTHSSTAAAQSSAAAPNKGGKCLVRKTVVTCQNISKSYATETQPNNYATHQSQGAIAVSQNCTEDIKASKNNSGNNTAFVKYKRHDSVGKINNGALTATPESSQSSQINGTYMSVLQGKTLKCEQSAPSVSTTETLVNSSSTNIQSACNFRENKPFVLTNHPSNYGVQNAQISLLRSSLSVETTDNNASSCKNHPHFDQSQTATTECHDDLRISLDCSQKQSVRIIMTNHGFQQVSSDSEANEEGDVTSSSSVTVDSSTADSPNNVNSNISSNLSKSNITTTNTTTFQNLPKMLKSATSKQELDVCREVTQFTISSSSSSCVAREIQSSSTSRQHPHQFENHLAKIKNKPVHLPLAQSQNLLTCLSRRVQCLWRSKSEQNISFRKRVSFIYDEHYRTPLNNDKVLERSASMSDISILCQRPWPFEDLRRQDQQKFNAENKINSHFHEHPPAHCTVARWICSTSPPSASSSEDCQKPHHMKDNQQIYIKQHHYHHQELRHQKLQLDLSNVTELDEDVSEFITSQESLSSSHVSVANEESPVADVDDSREFNRQFYSLCKVTSNKGSLVSGNPVIDKLSLFCISENQRMKSFKKSVDDSRDKNIKTSDNLGRALTGKQDITFEEIEEISQQIASLSKTVKELNHSLSSLNSGEFESTSYLQIWASPLLSQESTVKHDTDEYHWLDDETLLTPSNVEFINGSVRMVYDDTFGDVFTQNSSSELSSAQGFSSDIHTFLSREFKNQLVDGNLVGEDEIFAMTHYNTVKEKPHVKSKTQQTLPDDDDDKLANIRKNPAADTEENLSMLELRSDVQSSDTMTEGGEHSGTDKAGRIINQPENEQVDKLVSSNNESDDSLASDIGLDHMMCQRLFGSKGKFRTSYKHNTLSELAVTRFCHDSEVKTTDFVYEDNFSNSGSRRQAVDRSTFISLGTMAKLPPDETLNSNGGVLLCDTDENSRLPLFMPPGDRCPKETRDIGIDVMSKSQHSMNSSLETVNLSFPETCMTEPLSQISNFVQQSSSGFLDASSNPNREFAEGGRANETDKPRNTIYINTDSVNQDVNTYGHWDSKSKSLNQPVREATNTISDVASYSEFVADLEQSVAACDEAPPDLPPRRPIVSCGDRQIRKSFRQPPPPPPPSDISSEKCHHSDNKPHQSKDRQQRTHHHVPYVNQYIQSSRIQNSKILNSRKSNVLAASDKPGCSSAVNPPPLPPRKPHVRLELPTRPQESARSPRVPQSNSTNEVRHQSFKHCSVKHSKAALPFPPSTSPATYPRPRKHFQAHSSSTQLSLSERPKSETSSSKIPRHRLKTRRERSKSRQSTENSSLDSTAKSSAGCDSSTCKQWRDIDVVSGFPLSDTSCEDNNSS